MVGRAALGLLILFLVTTHAALVNRTIDDTAGDSVTLQAPTYQPASPWGGPSCVGCAIVPDRALAFDGTWHAATYHPELLNVNITISFTGVSIWVFFILANNNTLGPGITSNTECNFTLDGQLAGYFNHQPNESTFALQYNAVAFSENGLSNSQHELVISTNDLPYSAYFNFDYAIYTVDVPDSSVSATSTGSITTAISSTVSPAAQSHSLSSLTKLGIILGTVLGGLMLIVLVAVFMLFRRLKRKERSPTQHPVSAFNQEQPQSYRDELAMSDSHLPWGSSNQQSHNRSPSSNLASEVTLLVPVRRDNQPPPAHPHSTKSRDELRAVRQMEINQRLQNAQREMHDLTSRESMRSGPGSSTSDVGRQGAEHEMETMRESIRQLRTQIEQLQSERSSDWALGLSDNPPPAYD